MLSLAGSIFDAFMSPPRVRERLYSYTYLFNNGDVSRHEFPLPRNLEEALRSQLDSRKYGYTRPQGNDGVAQRIAQFERAASGNPQIVPSAVALTAGVTAALYAAFHQLDVAGKEVIIPVPTYQMGERIIDSFGGIPRYLVTKRENDFLPSASELESCIGPQTAGILLTSPNNPTGTEYGATQMADIYELARQKNVMLVIDEIFAGLMLRGAQHPRPQYNPAAGHIVRLNGWSKDRGVAGLRLGYLVASPQSVMRVADGLNLYYGNAPTAFNNFMRKDMLMRRFLLDPESVTAPFVEEFEGYRGQIDANIKKYESNSALIDQFCATTPAVIDRTPQHAGFTAFIRFATEKDDVAFAENLFSNSGAVLVPGAAFNAPEPGWMRLTYSVSPKTLSDGLQAMQDYLRTA